MRKTLYYENHCYYYLHSEVKRELAGVMVTTENLKTTLNGEIYFNTFCTKDTDSLLRLAKRIGDPPLNPPLYSFFYTPLSNYHLQVIRNGIGRDYPQETSPFLGRYRRFPIRTDLFLNIVVSRQSLIAVADH